MTSPSFMLLTFQNAQAKLQMHRMHGNARGVSLPSSAIVAAKCHLPNVGTCLRDCTRTRTGLDLNDAAFQRDHCRLRSIIGAQFGKDVLDTSFDGFLGDRELIGDLLVGISGCN